MALNFSNYKEDSLGRQGERNYAELGGSRKRRSIIFHNESDSREKDLSSGLEKCGFQVHHLELQYLVVTLEKSIMDQFSILTHI